MIEYELSCGCVQTAMGVNYIDLIMMCATHKKRYKLVAIECREWRMKCLSQAIHGTGRRQCGNASWHGADHSAAMNRAKKHSESTGHNYQEVDFLIQPGKRKYVENKFGKRKVKLIIVPKSRSHKIDGPAIRQRQLAMPYPEPVNDKGKVPF